jgi:hypothetical protein
MTRLFKVLAILVFITAATACSLNEKKLQPIAKPGQSDTNHDINVSFNFDIENRQGNRVSGFRLYKEGKLICETKDPESKNIECNIASPSGSFLFTITAYYDDGSESIHSEPFSYKIPD